MSIREKRTEARKLRRQEREAREARVRMHDKVERLLRLGVPELDSSSTEEALDAQIAAEEVRQAHNRRLAHGQAQVAEFITWLDQVLRIKGVTWVLLGDQLGPGGRKKIDNDLSGFYLPAWQYVVSTYLGPVQEMTKATLPTETLTKGKQLYEAAKAVAVPYVPAEPERESYSRVVAPVLAGFSLPAIVSLATAKIPGQPYRDIALSFFITATGFFLISFQLTIGVVYRRLYHWGKLRAGLTFFGIVFLVIAVMVLVAAVAEHWWVDLALAALGLGGVTSALTMGWIKLPISRRFTK